MKTFGAIVVIACVVALVQPASISQEMKEKFLVIAQECQGKTGASAEDLANLMQHNPTGTKEGKCLLSCIMEKVDTIDSNGKLNKEGAMHIAMAMTKNDPAEMKIAEEIIDSCVGINVSDDP